jgi:hypothetical protein
MKFIDSVDEQDGRLCAARPTIKHVMLVVRKSVRD